MATENTVNIGINVSDNGSTGKVTKDAKELKGVLDQAVAAAAKMGKGGAATLSSITQATGGANAAASYGAQRGVAGTTGAGARDFAKESEGLSGLVRVYATFAANIYAVSAAFSALSTAMDTANMIKGLDQLGAASGRGLGSLAKSLVAVTGGAITMRDSMGAVATSSAAGLTSEQILKMGTVATKASQALGINLTDAFSRISRGVTKLEPELLDELGLFTKLGPATEDYARSVGKSVGQLTDFEKRQAYANAVLKEGIDKFGKIDIDVNPFVKLSASFQNLVQSGLEIVNKVIGPLVSLLASSPTALTLVIAGLGSMLLKQAIPAIGQFRERLKEASENALTNVATKSTPYRQALVVDQAAITARAEAEAEKFVQARDAATDKFNALSKSKLGQMPTVSKILEKGIYQISEADLKMLDDRAARAATSNKALSASYAELAATIRAGIAAEAAYQAERAKGILLTAEAAEVSKKQMLADAEFRELGIKAVQREMAAKAAATTKELGLVASLKESWTQYLLIRKQGAMISIPMPGQFIEGPGGEKIPKRQDVRVDPIGRTAGLMGLVGASASAAATGIGAALSTLTGWGTAALMAYEAGSLLISAFTKTEKESATTTAAIEKLTDAGKTVNETLKDIASRNPFERLTIDSINARTTAFGELTLSISNMISSTNKEMDKMEGFDKFINFFKGIVGQDVQSKSSREFAKSIETAFKAAVPSEATTGARKKIEGILGVSVGDIDGLKQAYMSLGGSAGTQIKLVVDSLSTLAKEQQISAARGIELRDSWKESGKALTAFMTSSLPQDPLSKLGQDMMADAAKMQVALNDPIESLVVMKALAGDITALKLFPPEAARNMAKYSDELNMLSIKASNAKENLGGIDQEIASLSSKKVEIDVSIAAIKLGGVGADRLPLLEAEAEKLRVDIQRALDSKKASLDVAASVKLKQDEIKDVFGNAVRDQFVAGANILSSKVAIEWAKAATIVSGTLAGLLGDSLAAIDIKAKNDKLNIDAQMAAIRTQMYLIIATEKLSTQVELDRLSREKGNLDAMDRKSKEEGGTGKAAEIVKRETKLEDKLKNYENKTPEQLAVKGGSSKLIEQFKAGKEGVTREDINFQQMLEASTAQLNALGAQYKSVDITKEAGVIKIIYDQQSKAREAGKLAAQDELDKLSTLEAQGKILRDIDLQTKNVSQNRIVQAGADQQIDAINAQIALKQLVMSKLDQEKDDTNINRIKQEILILETIDKTKINQEAQNKILNNTAVLQKTLRDRAEERLKFEIETSRIIQSTNYTGRSTESEVAGIRLETEKAMDLLTADQYTKRKALLEISNLELAADKSRTTTQEKYTDILKDLENYKKTLFSETPEFDLAEKRIKAVQNQRDTELDAIGKVAAARRADIEERSKYSDRQNAYADVFKKSFEGMADAIVEFARTGKMSFKDLINNMIADLVRWELREQASSLYKSASPGLMNFGGMMGSVGDTIKNLVGGYTGGTTGSALVGLAQGGAYDMGIKKFAMGGSFANSIVDSPTLFKFASGTGLMGEAGPEAIMPLKRDSQGNLGVRSGNNGGNVEVVVHNYGSEKATTKESTDSRGNRKVEVIVGDLSAGEISRNGSNSQRSLRSTYGLQPALIRR